jgi:hypothetical protein
MTPVSGELDEAASVCGSELHERNSACETSSTGAQAFVTSPSCPSDATPIQSFELQGADVLSGRSPRACAHLGNQRYNNLVTAYSKLYKGASMRDEKAKITNEVIAEVESSGGRFVVEAGGEYIAVRTLVHRGRVPSRSVCPCSRAQLLLDLQMDRKSIYEKVAHALRSKRFPTLPRAEEGCIDARVQDRVYWTGSKGRSELYSESKPNSVLVSELTSIHHYEANVESGDDTESTGDASSTAACPDMGPPLLTTLLHWSKSDGMAMEAGGMKSQRQALLPVEAMFLLQNSGCKWRALNEPLLCAAPVDAPSDEAAIGTEEIQNNSKKVDESARGIAEATLKSTLCLSTASHEGHGRDWKRDVERAELSGSHNATEGKPGAEPAKADSFDKRKWLIVVVFVLYFVFILSVIVSNGFTAW